MARWEWEGGICELKKRDFTKDRDGAYLYVPGKELADQKRLKTQERPD